MSSSVSSVKKDATIKSVGDLTKKIQNYSPDIDIEKVKKAYNYSREAHEGQKRKSGEPYIIHPLQVADILASLNMDEASIITALLHDVVEDTKVSLEEISKEFGSHVAFLVDGVTKISRMKFRNLHQKQGENIRKMILAMGKDVRVILVKLADRLHNLRTLQHMPKDKQVRIGSESLEIYTPLAARLGMHEIKLEMEDLSLRYSSPETFKGLKDKISKMTKDRDSYTNKVIEVLRKELQDKTKIKNPEVQGRLKNIYSVYRKMAKYDLSLEDIHDLIAFRICVDEVHECYEVLGLIHSLWKPVHGRFKDYIATPKINGYQSLHTTVIGPDGYRIEIQIRTHKMHVMAERGIASHWIYKEGGTKDSVATSAIGKFNWLKDLVSLHQNSSDPTEFLENVKMDLFESEIYVFTPAGDIKELPKDATPIDFAYSVHTDVGSKIVGAKVNDRQVPIKHKLKNGDVVEVTTSSKQKPSKDWLKMCVTSKARSKIKNFLTLEERKKSLEIGQKIMEKSCQEFDVTEQEITSHTRYNNFLKNNGLNKLDDLYIHLGYGKILFRHIYEYLYGKKSTTSKSISQDTKKKKKAKVSPIIIEGADNIMVTLGKCCNPVSGDPIKAYVSLKKGIMVHRLQCISLSQIDPERFVEVDWRDQSDSEFFVSVKVACEDRPGTLLKFSEAFSSFGLNITDVQVRKSNDLRVFVIFGTHVKNLAQLNQLKDRLNQLDGVISVSRLAGKS